MKTDVLVIGSGVAGLSCALRLAEHAEVVLVTKAGLMESNTRYAQGGLAAAVGTKDSFKMHAEDTKKAGDGLCFGKAVSALVSGAPDAIRWLEKVGVVFDRNGEYALGIEAVHSQRRVVHVGDMSGIAVQAALVKAVEAHEKITVIENGLVFALHAKKGRCRGCSYLDEGNSIAHISCGAVVLATGGIGHLYARTCNPSIATGDGIALAYAIGAELMDLEFVQFHPTGFSHSDPALLISETLRGEGGILVNGAGQRFMGSYHPDWELAPRDVVARACAVEMQKSKQDVVYLDVTMLGGDFLLKRFPHIHKQCLGHGIDFVKERIPVSPTAHYLCGGVKVDLCGETSIAGLYAVGEVACSGVHGSDRLASNSLIEGVVFAERVKDAVLKHLSASVRAGDGIDGRHMVGGVSSAAAVERIRTLMWERVGIVRNTVELQKAVEELRSIEGEIRMTSISKGGIQLRNMALVGRLIAESALARKESRGTHYNEDFKKSEGWKKHSVLSKEGIRFQSLQ